jgi:Tfp pilus assembly protein FimT
MQISSPLLSIYKNVTNLICIHKKKTAGFTLLELMVVFSLTTMLAGGGFFSFAKYSQSQEFNRGLEMVTLTYDLARNSAISNVKPESECSSSAQSTTVLEGYRVDLTDSSVTLVTDCNVTDVLKVQKLPPNVKIRNSQNCSGVIYKTITGNVVISNRTLPCTMEISHNADPENLFRTVVVTPEGRLSIGGRL